MKWLQWYPAYGDTLGRSQGCHCRRGDLYCQNIKKFAITIWTTLNPSTAFCDSCLTPVHNHHKRRDHKSTRLEVPQEYLERTWVFKFWLHLFGLMAQPLSQIYWLCCRHSTLNSSSSRMLMELFAVVCIETSHYVSFVKCGSSSDAPWCFFDSMADRKG